MSYFFKNIALLLAFTILLLLIPISQVYAEDRTLICEQFDVSIKIHRDGSFDVSEYQRIKFTSGVFQQGFREIPRLRLEVIDNFVLTDDDGNPYKLAKSDEASKTPYTFTVTENNNYKIQWYFPATRNSSKGFTISYTVHGALRIYPEGDQLWWNAIFADRQYSIESGTVQVVLPKGIQIDEYNAYIAGESANRRVRIALNETNPSIICTLQQPLEPGKGLEVRTQFSHGVVESSPPAWQLAEDSNRGRKSTNTQGDEISLRVAWIINWLIFWMLP